MKPLIALLLIVVLCAFDTRCHEDPPCPVELVSFTGHYMPPSQVILEWQTLSETNNYGFFVLRNNVELLNVFIPGHGTTNVPQDYSWLDLNPGVGFVGYRLKQVDLDGTITITEEILVRVPNVIKTGS